MNCSMCVTFSKRGFAEARTLGNLDFCYSQHRRKPCAALPVPFMESCGADQAANAPHLQKEEPSRRHRPLERAQRQLVRGPGGLVVMITLAEVEGFVAAVEAMVDEVMQQH